MEENLQEHKTCTKLVISDSNLMPTLHESVLKHSLFLESMFVILSYQLKCRKLRHNPNLDQIQLRKHEQT